MNPPSAPPSLPPPARQALLALARAAIAERLGLVAAAVPEPLPDCLLRPGAAFVSLHLAGELRGCIGTLEARESLADCVSRQACQAAFSDPRFPPLTAREWPGIQLEVTVLGPSRAIREPGEFIPGEHGIILEKQGHRAVFLPQVAPEQGWDRAQTLTHLARKAGLPAEAWRQGAYLSVFTAEHFGDQAGEER